VVLRARLDRTCWTISELNPVRLSRFDSGAYSRLQSAILSALTESLQPRDDSSSSSSSSEDEDEDDKQARVPAATTTGASESETAAAATTSDDRCEVCIVAPRAGFELAPGGHARFCEACAMRVSVRELANLVCRTYE